MTTFLLSEDEAMKSWLTGMTVSDSSDSARPVKVWFRLPEQEQRDVTYPFVSIDLIDINEALDRNHRGRLRVDQMGYIPEGLTAGLNYQTIDYPIPFDLDYQVTTFSRSARHDRALQTQVWKRFLGRFGVIPVEDTAREAQLLGAATGDQVDQYGKRLFTKIYSIRVVSELVPSEALQAQLVLTRHLDIVSI
jgi:hypothetical protein